MGFMQAEAIRQEICEVGKLLYEHKLVAASEGNISMRLNNGEILITPSGVCKGRLEPAMLVRCMSDGTVCTDDTSGYTPSSEIGLHLRIYQERPDVAAVVHAHPPIATAFGVLHKALDGRYLPEALMGIGEVPVCDYAPPSSAGVADNIMPFVHDHNAALMARHGAVSWGKNLWQAFDYMEELEHIARIYAAVEQLGGAEVFDGEELGRHE